MSTEVATSFYFDPAALMDIARERAATYRAAWPFPHTVLEDFLPAAVACGCEAELAQASREHWQHYTDEGNTQKLELSDETRMGPVARHLVGQFSGRAMIAFLEELTGIQGLVADPYLIGGGLHELRPGGFLRIHADFNVHGHLKLDRRINLLVYLNPDWDPSWGGELELWDAGMSRRAEPIAPLLGRAVIFNVTDRSFHGNPNVVRCPPDRARRSLAFYYYTNGRPEEERAAAHTTLYQTPGRPPVTAAPARPEPSRARRLVRDLTPPLLLRSLRRARGR